MSGPAKIVSSLSSALSETSRLPPMPTIRDILRMYNLRAQKQLSQNFIMNPYLQHKIVRTAGKVDGCYVCEVGPGPGGITRAILERGAKQLAVVEKDRRFLPCLELLCNASENRMKIVLGDIFNFQMESVFPKEIGRQWLDDPPDIHVIGNLPFNVSTPLIIRWLRDASYKRGIFAYGRVRLTLTFQKEVAERIVAKVNSVQRCRLSIMCQHLCHVDLRFTIPGTAFVPKPDVDVGVVHLVPRRFPMINLPFEVVEKFMRNTFHFRQKYCIRGVEVLFPKDKREQLTKELFEMANVSMTTRPYSLTMRELNRMVTAYHTICQNHSEVTDYDYRAPGADCAEQDQDEAPNESDSKELTH